MGTQPDLSPVSAPEDILLGVLYGDCLGAATEFDPGPIPNESICVATSRFGHPPGTGTDDTETTLAVAQGLLKAHQQSAETTEVIADELLAWWKTGPLDVGMTTSEALSKYQTTKDPRGGPNHNRSVANGSLMRSAPFALLKTDRAPLLAANSSRTTHAHPTVLACVSAYVEITRQLHQHMLVPSSDLWERMPGASQFSNVHAIPKTGTGHAVYAFNLAIWSATWAEDFTSGLRTVIRLGGDTDTNGAICGAVLAARFGFPEKHLQELAPERVEELSGLARQIPDINV